MKLNKLALTLTAAALLPTFAYAGADEVVASFQRDLQREPSATLPMTARAEADPLDVVNHILNRETDAALASFERVLYYAPAAQTVQGAREADPLVDAINVALQTVFEKPSLQAAIASNGS